MLRIPRVGLVATVCLAIACTESDPIAPARADTTPHVSTGASATLIAPMYFPQFVATASTGMAMNDAGDIAGTSYLDPGCAPFCLGTLQTVAWHSGARLVLPALGGFTGVSVRGMNNQGWIVGLAGTPGTTTRAVAWMPNGPGYSITNLGVLPGKTIAEATGIDDSNRIVGWSGTLNIFQPYVPFLWTSAGGLADMTAAGYPAEKPEAISPNGTVATANKWYRLGTPGSVTTVPPAPAGFLSPGATVIINDQGDQARFLTATSSQSLRYPFRLPAGGAWQQLSSLGTGTLTRYGLGSINTAGDITLTIQSSGFVAPGPSGVVSSLTSRVSPAYPGAGVASAGPMNASAHILASVFLGRSPRLTRLVPVTPCLGNCTRVSAIAMTGVFVQDPRFPGQCFAGGSMRNDVTAKFSVTTETGSPLARARVFARFLDDYYMNKAVAGTTGTKGNTTVKTTTRCGVGAIAVLVDSVVAGTRQLDRTAGVLTNYVIPR